MSTHVNKSLIGIKLVYILFLVCYTLKKHVFLVFYPNMIFSNQNICPLLLTLHLYIMITNFFFVFFIKNVIMHYSMTKGQTWLSSGELWF